jgi:sigma-B regulation protein RsbU (phosphoserine phosphatase)
MSDDPAMPAGDITILVVEDSLTQALKLQHLLERHNLKVITASNGKEALAKLAASIPTLVVTDITMPEMDGYELCQRIKDDTKIKELPVILLTSLSDPEDILKGLECGADNFIVKPYDEEFLLSRIQHVMANLELRKQAHGQEPAEIYFAGRKYKLTADRIHSIDLLLSTYETAVHKNLELTRAKETLETQAEELREKNAQMTEELEMARDLQTAFLPRDYPVFPQGVSSDRSAIRFCHRYHATQEIGGDFFDVLRLSDTEAGIFICDVMGHGVRAALVTAIVRGLIEELRPKASDAGAFITELNHALFRILRQTSTPLFASAYYAIVDTGRGEVRFANAGHPAAFHVRRKAGIVSLLKQPGVKPSPVLGIIENAAYPEAASPLEPGDAIVLFTDGLYELENSAGEYFDPEQLRAAVARRQATPTPQLLDDLFAELKIFGQQESFSDDVCVIAADIAQLADRAAKPGAS